MPAFITQIMLIILSCGCLGFGLVAAKQGHYDELLLKASWDLLNPVEPFEGFQNLKNDILWQEVGGRKARLNLKTVNRNMRQLARRTGCAGSGEADWVFPVEGYGESAIGGKGGDGFVPGPFRYFDGNNALGHPAQDIFINDRNYDSKDDATGRPVAIKAFSGGIVVAKNDHWRPGDELRGGIYIDIFDPSRNRLYYYAHLKKLHPRVRLGACISAGDELGILGRSGKNAFPRRSPTHLHFSVYQLEPNGQVTPLDPYPMLIQAINLHDQ